MILYLSDSIQPIQPPFPSPSSPPPHASKRKAETQKLTSVYFVASTFMKGAWDSLAIRRAISVLPQPVGPIMRMFFGITYFVFM